MTEPFPIRSGTFVLPTPGKLAEAGLDLKLVGQPGDNAPAPLMQSWRKRVASIQEFRGAVAWDNGRRPAFRQVDGTLRDSDPVDAVSWHILIIRAGGRILGCVRYAPLEALGEHSHVRRAAPVAATSLLQDMKATDRDVLEGGRLIVASEARNQGFAAILLAAGTLLARNINRRLIWGTAGNRQDQERIFRRLGYARYGSTTFAAPKFDDELSLVYQQTTSLPPNVAAAIDEFFPPPQTLP
ncbi:hypothetical protein Pth03_39030 [Planotetraspora thailandica]|uniref:N-acetyltransferase domain-containing protein n=1 Tax=Planotetraspora thailandica TaxID=487172 RepID=A0A8J3V7Q3_9ACTN|nr:GNAT family N-acetyltransferase [Planotetraspora thailandica]GII55514.1 hypothetical protein Pth03_39030 [Planotetraspora thailandica]